MSATLSPVRQELADLCAAILPGLHGAPGTHAHTISAELWAALTAFDPPQPGSFLGPKLPVPGPGRTRRSFLDLIPVVPAAFSLYVPQFNITNVLGAGIPPRAPAAVKPTTNLVFAGREEVLRSIATIMNVNDELLDDVPQLEAWLKTWLKFLVTLNEEQQVVNGDGTGNNLLGFTNRPEVIESGPGPNRTSIIAAAFHEIIAQTGFVPDGVVVDFLADLLPEVSAVEWVDGEPFIYGMRVYSCAGMNQGLVGCFGAGAVLGRNGGITVEGTQSHDVAFVYNASTLRAESRLALGVIVPEMFRKLPFPA
jgi:hypothetical protein